METPIPPNSAKTGTLVGNMIIPYDTPSRMFINTPRITAGTAVALSRPTCLTFSFVTALAACPTFSLAPLTEAESSFAHDETAPPIRPVGALPAAGVAEWRRGINGVRSSTTADSALVVDPRLVFLRVKEEAFSSESDVLVSSPRM